MYVCRHAGMYVLVYMCIHVYVDVHAHVDVDVEGAIQVILENKRRIAVEFCIWLFLLSQLAFSDLLLVHCCGL